MVAPHFQYSHLPVTLMWLDPTSIDPHKEWHPLNNNEKITENNSNNDTTRQQ